MGNGLSLSSGPFAASGPELRFLIIIWGVGEVARVVCSEKGLAYIHPLEYKKTAIMNSSFSNTFFLFLQLNRQVYSLKLYKDLICLKIFYFL